MMELPANALSSLQKRFERLNLVQLEGALAFGRILYRENERQNLTRIQGFEDFVEGHMLDVVELLSLDWLGDGVADVGSGSGVPGLLAAAMDRHPNREWNLIESEWNKADYLATAAKELGLGNVSVFGDRAEAVMGQMEVDTVIARAVGTVDKIAAWVWKCSTWNNLVLFKSRGWEAEWEAAKTTKFGRKLTVTQTHEYSSQGKYRVLINLKRLKNG